MIEKEAMAENKKEASVVDEVGVLTTTSTTIRREQKAQHEAEEEASTTRDMISLKLNAIIAISLVTIQGSIELQIKKSKRRPIMPSRIPMRVVHCY